MTHKKALEELKSLEVFLVKNRIFYCTDTKMLGLYHAIKTIKYLAQDEEPKTWLSDGNW